MQGVEIDGWLETGNEWQQNLNSRGIVKLALRACFLPHNPSDIARFWNSEK
jgi:hypothetical protein